MSTQPQHSSREPGTDELMHDVVSSFRVGLALSLNTHDPLQSFKYGVDRLTEKKPDDAVAKLHTIKLQCASAEAAIRRSIGRRAKEATRILDRRIAELQKAQ